MAFCFLYKSSYWSPKVAEDGLQVLTIDTERQRNEMASCTNAFIFKLILCLEII